MITLREVRSYVNLSMHRNYSFSNELNKHSKRDLRKVS